MKLRNAILWLITCLLIFLVVAILLLQTSVAQNYLTKLALSQVNKDSEFRIELDEISILWFDKVQIDGLSIYDYRDQLMIYAGETIVDYELSGLLNESYVQLDLLSISQSRLALVNYDDSLGINMIEFLNDLKGNSVKPKKKPPVIFLKEIMGESIAFSYNNQQRDSLDMTRFDYAHFQLDMAKVNGRNLEYDSGSIFVELEQVLGMEDESSGFSVDKLSTSFSLTPDSLSLLRLKVTTPSSKIEGDVSFLYDSIRAFSDFINAVPLNVSLSKSLISSKDIGYFVNLPTEAFSAEIETQIKGPVSRLSLEDLTLMVGNSKVVGDVSFVGLPLLNETFIDANIQNSIIHTPDISIFTKELINALKPLGNIKLNGAFIGFLDDFVTNMTIDTKLGSVKSDLNLKFPSGLEKATYSGKLNLLDFDCGRLLNNKSVGKVTLEGKISGKGTTLQNAKFYLDANLWRSELLGYNYQSLHVSGNFASEYFDGELTVNDPNCMIEASGSIDLASEPEVLFLEAKIDSIDFQSLGFLDKKLQVDGLLSANLKSLDLDSIQGEVRMDSINLKWEGKHVAIDSVELSSYMANGYRSLDLALPELQLELEGDFVLSQVIADYKAISNDLTDYFDIDDSQAKARIPVESEDYSIDFFVNLGDISSYGEAFLNDEFYLSPDNTIEGTFYQRQNATLSLYTSFDSVFVNGIGFSENEIDLNLSKSTDSKEIVAVGFLNSERQWWRDNLPTENLSLEAVWFDDEINITSNISQPANNNSAYLNGHLKLEKERLVFSFAPSRLMAFDEQWFFDPSNQVIFEKDYIQLDRMQLFQGEQSISVLGTISTKDSTQLSVSFENFDLLFLSALLPFQLGGELNTLIDISTISGTDHFIMESYLDITNLELNNVAVGDVYGRTAWEPAREGLELDLQVSRESFNNISIVGYYQPQEAQDQLDLTADFDRANLKLLEPFFVGIFSNVHGFADGQIIINGTLQKPILLGQSSLTDGSFKLDYLGTIYSFDGGLSFTNDAINFEGFKLLDRGGNRASLDGSIFHEGLKKLKADISVAASSFQFLNTSSLDNSLYYGTAYATGDIQIMGPFEDIVINAKGRTERGTKFFIPLTSTTEITQKEYITFVNMSDSSAQVNIEDIVAESISGVSLNFELEVTPDAYTELIFDVKTGDIIRGRGNGNLSLSLDTNGEFELFGDLNITEGGYNFTIPAIGINKEFNVVPGSTISWFGDPYAGILDLSATYRQLASLSSYNEDFLEDQRYPILVSLNLDGEMLAPNINFAIELEDGQVSPGSNIGRALLEINNDEQELKRQVFSLLILRKFSPRSSFEVGGSPLQGSISELMSNQLSYFISQVDENLEVDVDLASLDADAFNTFQLRLAYTFLNGRLRVSGGGSLPQNEANQQLGASDYLGDWSLRYLLTDDGHFRIKAFSQTSQIANELQQRETGISFQYVKSFDDLKELLTRTRETAIQGRAKDVSKEQSANKTN
ncbi:MAG: translocation/assembly module TamB [Cyclobacteriaceae bacterium]